MERINPNKLHLNKDNPRFIKDEKFAQLVKSIKDFPEMLEKHPIVFDEVRGIPSAISEFTIFATGFQRKL